MTARRIDHLFRMERLKSWLRLGVVLLACGDPLAVLSSAWGHGVGLTLWSAALIWAVGIVLIEPYRRGRLIVWDVTSGFIDWGLITLGIVVTGGTRSDLYLLYFLSVLSIAMRHGFREVVFAGAGAAAGYLLIAMALTGAVPPAAVGLRAGYLLLFAIGGGLLAREARRQARARSQEVAQRLAVQEVTATVSHDLKNPLAAITGLVEILLDSAADRLTLDQRALLHRINANTQQMRELVNNLLDAELIERGQQKFRPSNVNVNGLVRNVVETQAHQAEVKHIGLVLDLCPHLPSAVLDRHMIERLVANLLVNAIKFTPHGGAIRVSTAQRGAQVIIEVWDSGPGVPAPVQATLFDKFVRQPDSNGIGLGLYICNSVVAMHRGRIRVHDPAEGGVTFVVELPLQLPFVLGASSMPRTSSRDPRLDSAAAAVPVPAVSP